jgi:hypothetical protein
MMCWWRALLDHINAQPKNNRFHSSQIEHTALVMGFPFPLKCVHGLIDQLSAPLATKGLQLAPENDPEMGR